MAENYPLCTTLWCILYTKDLMKRNQQETNLSPVQLYVSLLKIIKVVRIKDLTHLEVFEIYHFLSLA